MDDFRRKRGGDIFPEIIPVYSLLRCITSARPIIASIGMAIVGNSGISSLWHVQNFRLSIHANSAYPVSW
jgi:hypothetical protein